MDEKKYLIGQNYYLEVLKSRIAKLKSGQGTVILVSGESGFGKSNLVSYTYDDIKNNYKDIRAAISETQAPIGSFQIGNIQPLYPFNRIIEEQLKDKELNPSQEFTKSIGLTVLASIPLIDSVFYAVKEIEKDYKKYKTDMTKTHSNSTITSYLNAIKNFTERKSLMMLIDDMHWSDTQSIELLRELTESIKTLPIILVLTYKRSILDNKGLPFISYIQQYSKSENVINIDLKSFNQEHISELCKIYFNKYKKNNEFEEWILEHSHGEPGIVCEYLRYYSKYNPFAPDGSLVMNFKDNEFLPGNVNALFAQILDTLSEEERNLLAICSAEGYEFTAFIVSHLLGTDVVTTIKRLRSLQNKTNFIKSIGVQNRFGFKTTVYKFTQGFYHSFFRKTLEYEEYVSLHAQIAALLKQKYYETDNIDLQQEIAPYIAAHSVESGDSHTAHDMLVVSAKNALKYGSKEIMETALGGLSGLTFNKDSEESDIDGYKEIVKELQKMKFNENLQSPENQNNNNNEFADNEAVSSSSVDESYIDFKLLRKSLINDFMTDNQENVIKKAEKFLNERISELTTSEQIQLLILSAKASLDLGDFESSEKKLLEAKQKLTNNNDPVSECILANVFALYYFYQSNLNNAYSWIKRATSITYIMPSELKLLTMSVLSIIMRETSDEDSYKYRNVAKKLSQELNFELLESEL